MQQRCVLRSLPYLFAPHDPLSLLLGAFTACAPKSALLRFLADSLEPATPGSHSIDIKIGVQENDTEAAGTTHTSTASSWLRAIHALSAKGCNTDASNTAAPFVPLKTHRCYKIPEDEAAAATVDAGEPTDRAHSKCKWRCPLSAKKSDLPSNARLENNILGIGAEPNMKACRWGSSKRKGRCGAAILSADQTGATAAAAPVEHNDASPRQHVPPLNPHEAGEGQCSGLVAGAAMAQAEMHAHACENTVEPGTAKVAAILSPRQQPTETLSAVHEDGSDCSGPMGRQEPPAHNRDTVGAHSLDADALRKEPVARNLCSPRAVHVVHGEHANGHQGGVGSAGDVDTTFPGTYAAAAAPVVQELPTSTSRARDAPRGDGAAAGEALLFPEGKQHFRSAGQAGEPRSPPCLPIPHNQPESSPWHPGARERQVSAGTVGAEFDTALSSLEGGGA